MKLYPYSFLLMLLLGLAACNTDDKALFTRLESADTGIDFQNETGENDSFNILTNEYIYNGGGVGIGDFNADGKPDVFLSGCATPNKLFLNQGNWKFADITLEAGVDGSDRWSGGVTIVDVNNDGLEDIYVCATTKATGPERANQLFLNQGPNEAGLPTFVDVAPQYGIADTSHTTQAAWLDFDLDGDLDLFVMVNKMVDNRKPNIFKHKVTDGSGERTDHLYRQDQVNGEIRFVEVGKSHGILYEGFGLGVSVCDLNRDGRPDLYVTNDYLSNDLIYLNTLTDSGTVYFRDIAPTLVKQTSFSAMGNDVVDMNNDGRPDLLAVDMLPEDNFRRKMMLPANNYTNLINNERYGYQPQFVRNTLQISQGAKKTGLPEYSEVAMYAGLPATDWSWTPLVADFDQDGLKDVIITNGFPRDITDHDFGDYQVEYERYLSQAKMLPQIPSVKLRNQAFRAVEIMEGLPRYENVSTDWGITLESFSNGAAYADFDGDGDLDYIVNNLYDPVHVFRNNLRNAGTGSKGGQPHYLKIVPAPEVRQVEYLGAELVLLTDRGLQSAYWHSHRGYLSSHGKAVFFGLGNSATVDSLIVRWPNGVAELFSVPEVDTEMALRPGDGTRLGDWDLPASTTNPPLKAVQSPNFIHAERDYIDFNVQPMLLRKLSQQGPGLAVSDLDGDGQDELLLGGSFDRESAFFQSAAEGLVFAGAGPFSGSKATQPEELGNLFFDADGDGDDDLYTVIGSYEMKLEEVDYRDCFFRNEGGVLVRDTQALAGLPELSGSCVRAADYDLDGDLDLFIGTRVEPHAYPKPVFSLLLKNESSPAGIRFVVDEEGTNAIKTAYNVCDAVFSDYDGDGRPDLLLAGEWAPLRVYHNTEAGWVDNTEALGLTNHLGWWNSLAAGDFDNDGDIDYLAGNYGKNTILQPSEAYPLQAYLTDLDLNGTLDFIPGAYFPTENGTKALFPFFNRIDFAKQIVAVKGRHKQHADFAKAELETYYLDEGQAAELEDYHFVANFLETAYLENTGEGFVIRPLNATAQTFPVFGMLPIDLNGDDFLDVLLIGNDQGNEVSQGYMNAGNGLALLGDGKGAFTALSPDESGFYVPGEGRSISVLRTKEGPMIVATQNTGPLAVFQPKGDYRFIPLDKPDTAELPGGASRKVEPYWGSGYLGQVPRGVFLPTTAAN